MNARLVFPVLALIALIALVCLVHELDYREITTHKAVIYSHPQMEAPCREPNPQTEMRIWIDKRLSATEGVRTCRVIPLSGDDSPRKAMKSAINNSGVRG